MTDNIYNEDCLVGMQRIPTGSVDLIVTDPPYLISTSGAGFMRNAAKSVKQMGDLRNANLCNGFDAEILDEMVRVMRGINVYIWASKRQIPMYIDFFVKKHRCSMDILIWYKRHALPFFSKSYIQDKEFCLYFRKRGFCAPQCFDDARTVFQLPPTVKEKKRYGHPTVKPLTIIETMVKNSSRLGDIVLDPFLGSGTTAVAARNLGRRYIGFEIDAGFFRAAKERLANEIS